MVRMSMLVKITNIKVSIKIDVQSLDSVEKTLADSKNECKKFNNFIVFRHNLSTQSFELEKRALIT